MLEAIWLIFSYTLFWLVRLLNSNLLWIERKFKFLNSVEIRWWRMNVRFYPFKWHLKLSYRYWIQQIHETQLTMSNALLYPLQGLQIWFWRSGAYYLNSSHIHPWISGNVKQSHSSLNYFVALWWELQKHSGCSTQNHHLPLPPPPQCLTPMNLSLSHPRPTHQYKDFCPGISLPLSSHSPPANAPTLPHCWGISWWGMGGQG